jgi:PIN domain nuclease of toxin-antitoxin system
MSGDQIRLDTHVVVWLFNDESEKFSGTARRLLDERTLVVSPIIELELSFLHEIGRLGSSGPVVVNEMMTRINLKRSEEPFHSVVAAAESYSWTRDPFDRLIVGDASAAACQLLTCDRHIREHFPLAVW